MSQRMGWSEFWPFYLQEHDQSTNRVLHVIGTTLAFLLLVTAVILQWWWALLLGLVAGYLFAWVGHFVFQKNRPATFRYPIKSFVSDWRLWALTLVGRAGRAYDKHGIPRR